jgi:hypothetical protein
MTSRTRPIKVALSLFCDGAVAGMLIILGLFVLIPRGNYSLLLDVYRR